MTIGKHLFNNIDLQFQRSGLKSKIEKCVLCNMSIMPGSLHNNELCSTSRQIQDLESNGYIHVGHTLLRIATALDMRWLRPSGTNRWNPSEQLNSTIYWIAETIPNDFKLIELKGMMSDCIYGLASKSFMTSHAIVISMMTTETTKDPMVEFEILQEYKSLISNIFI